MSWLESPAANLFLLLPDFFWRTMEISSLFLQGCLLFLNITLRSLLVKPQIGFLLCLLFEVLITMCYNLRLYRVDDE